MHRIISVKWYPDPNPINRSYNFDVVWDQWTRRLDWKINIECSQHACDSFFIIVWHWTFLFKDIMYTKIQFLLWYSKVTVLYKVSPIIFFEKWTNIITCDCNNIDNCVSSLIPQKSTSSTPSTQNRNKTINTKSYANVYWINTIENKNIAFFDLWYDNNMWAQRAGPVKILLLIYSDVWFKL